jgi:hypothetical protein
MTSGMRGSSEIVGSAVLSPVRVARESPAVLIRR